MVSLRDHGGACCGVRHIYGFDQSQENDFERLVRQVDDMTNIGTRQAHRMIEVILADRQADKFPWLERRGFRLVSRFENANSGRFCNVFHYHPNFLALNTGEARNWNGARHSTGGDATTAAPHQPVAPAPAPVRDILTLYQNVFADGREGGMYLTFEAAREAAPRCRRQDRIVYRSDGTNQRTNNF